MKTDIRIYLSGNTKDPENLKSGHVIQVSSGLSGVIPILEQMSESSNQFESLKSTLQAQYGAGNVTDTSSSNPVYYKWEWVEGEGFRQVCYYNGSLQVQFSIGVVVGVDFETSLILTEDPVAVATATAVT